jgi:hypothetical protein
MIRKAASHFALARLSGSGSCTSARPVPLPVPPGSTRLTPPKSLKRGNVLLSYQIWQDEAAMTAWRVNPAHHGVQVAGREKVFDDYRIRIAQVIHEARPQQPAWRPERLTPYNDPARRPPTYVLASESKNAELPMKTEWSCDASTSVYREGYFAHPAWRISFASSQPPSAAINLPDPCQVLPITLSPVSTVPVSSRTSGQSQDGRSR